MILTIAIFSPIFESKKDLVAKGFFLIPHVSFQFNDFHNVLKLTDLFFPHWLGETEFMFIPV